MKFEILAPAGSMESLIAGVRSGANAVYLGGKSFNARRNAGNFDNEELKKAVEYCHCRDVKVYLTLNILVRDDEMREAYDTVKAALLCGVDIDFVCKENQNAVLTVKTDKKEVKAVGEIPEKAINKPMNTATVSERLSKFGGTQYYVKNINVTLDDGLIMPASKINEMRRTAIQKLDEQEKIKLRYKAYDVAYPKFEKNDVPYATASFANASQIPDNHPFKRVFIPINSSLEDFVDNRAGVVLPRGLFSIENEIKAKLEKLKKAGVSKALCGNIGSYTLCKNMGFEVYGDFGLNVYNCVSANQIEHPILSFELTQAQINSIKAEDTGMIVYGYLPLMLTRNCPIKNDIGCFECNKHGKLTDRKGMEFPVICSDFPCVEMLNCYPLYMLDRIKEVKTDFVHFYFSIESQKQVENIISLYEQGAKPDFKYTRGLYQRGTL